MIGYYGIQPNLGTDHCIDFTYYRWMRRFGRYNDEVALQAIELLANNNIQIPKEVAVISFDNSSYSELAPIKITLCQR